MRTYQTEMSRATVELDFFNMAKDTSSTSRLHKVLPRQRSFRDIQSAISKINPELLRSVIASGSANQKSVNGNQFASNSKSSLSVPSTPKEERSPLFPTLPDHYPSRNTMENLTTETAPLTIFYNGTVAVFDVAKDKAETILKLAEKGIARTVETTEKVASTEQKQLLETLNNGDLPIARRKSLQKFLEKRQERLTSGVPYSFSSSELNLMKTTEKKW